jgi:hypothetical protein
MINQEFKRGDIIFLENLMCDVIRPAENGILRVSHSNNANRIFNVNMTDWVFMGTDGSYYRIFEKFKDYDLGL